MVVTKAPAAGNGPVLQVERVTLPASSRDHFECFFFLLLCLYIGRIDCLKELLILLSTAIFIYVPIIVYGDRRALD
jgi:hypothetical protein